MARATRKLSARWRNSILYNLSLTDKAVVPGWAMQVEKAGLAAAIEDAMRRRPAAGSGLRRGFAAAAVLTVCEGGLSVRFSDFAADIPASGMWASPLAADGFMLLRVLARLPDERVDLSYCDGRLALNDRSVRAREI